MIVVRIPLREEEVTQESMYLRAVVQVVQTFVEQYFKKERKQMTNDF